MPRISWQAKAWFRQAGSLTRASGRCACRAPGAQDDIDLRSSRDWAETGPNGRWRAARPSSPRRATGPPAKAWRAAPSCTTMTGSRTNGFGVLELIMTAPVVVASWISLQYYGSTVAPEPSGRQQAVCTTSPAASAWWRAMAARCAPACPGSRSMTARRYAHDPLRLSVCIEAPREAMTDILKRHDGVRESVRQPLAAPLRAGCEGGWPGAMTAI
jgi:hypothetical protein